MAGRRRPPVDAFISIPDRFSMEAVAPPKGHLLSPSLIYLWPKDVRSSLQLLVSRLYHQLLHPRLGTLAHPSLISQPLTLNSLCLSHIQLVGPWLLDCYTCISWCLLFEGISANLHPTSMVTWKNPITYLYFKFQLTVISFLRADDVA